MHELRALHLADPSHPWAALGFEVVGDTIALDGVGLRLGRSGTGIAGWTILGVDTDIDGLISLPGDAPSRPVDHPNGARALDHVVVISPDFSRTRSALETAGLPLKRFATRHGRRQGFRRLGPTTLELVEATEAPPGPAHFWGLTITVADLDALAERLGDRLGRVKEAVQPGRRIATLRPEAGLGAAVAFMDR